MIRVIGVMPHIEIAACTLALALALAIMPCGGNARSKTSQNKTPHGTNQHSLTRDRTHRSATDTHRPSRPEMISVIGQRTTTRSLVVKRSNAATKTDTPLLETMQSISSVSRTQMDLLNARNLTEALRYSSGVSTSSAGVISRYDMISIRGFGTGGIGADEYVDGLKLFNGNYVATQQIDSYLLDQIDVLKGPPSVIYGQSTPGGVVALTSKLPTRSSIHSLSLEGGSYDYVRGTADFGGTLDSGGHFLYRLAATGMSSRSQDLHTDSQRLAIMPSISWVPNDKVNFTITGFYQTDPKGGDYGLVPLEGSILHNPHGRLSTHFYAGDQNYDQYTRQQAAIGYQFRYQISHDWSFRSTARYAHVNSHYKQLLGDGLASDDETLTRYAAAVHESFDTMTVEEQLLGHIRTGRLQHTILFGVNWQNLRDNYDYSYGLVSSINIFSPANTVSGYNPSLTSAYAGTTNQEGIFTEDQMSLGRLHAQIGVREDWSSIKTRDHLYGENYAVNNHAFTWRAGLLYAFPKNISFYFNYSESFQPITTLSQSGAPFKPSRGRQEEVGLKYSPKFTNGFFSAALFNLQETNVLVTDPGNSLYYIQTGGIKAQGIELETHADLTRNLSLILSYSYLHEIYNRQSGSLSGERPVQIPSQTVSAWGRYQFHEGPLKNLGLSLGVRYTGNTIADATLEYVTPSYTLLDGSIDYDLGSISPKFHHTTIQLTAQNLTNKRYVSSCQSEAFGCYWGPTRNIIGKINVQW